MSVTSSGTSSDLAPAANSARLADALVKPPLPMPGNEMVSRFERTPRERWLDEWAAHDFNLALAWSRQQAPELRDWAMDRLVMLMAQRDPEAALYLCEEESLDVRLPRTTAAAAQLYAVKAPEAAYRWMLRLPPGGALLKACEPRLLAEFARTAPDFAGLMVLNAAGNEPDAQRPPDIFQKWTQIAPATAGAWLLTKDFPWRSAAINPLMANWIIVDQEEARSWLDAVPPGQIKDQALAAFEQHRLRAPDA